MSESKKTKRKSGETKRKSSSSKTKSESKKVDHAKKSSSSSSTAKLIDDPKATELKDVPQFKRRTGRFSEIVRKSAATSTASFSSNRLTRRTIRQKKGLTELIGPRSKPKGVPLNDSELQLNVVENFCTYLERYALGIDGIFTHGVPEQQARNIATLLNQDTQTIDFQQIVEPPELVAASLLSYLQSHKRAMVPSKSYDSFVDANAEAKDEKRIEKLRVAVRKLPTQNRQICGRLLRLFYAISENAELTGTDAATLGGIFGDILLHNKKGGDQASGADVFSFMIQNYYPIVFMAEYEAEQEEKKAYDFDVTLTENDWKLLLTNAKLYKYKKDQAVINEGEPNTALFRVRKGTFTVSKGGTHIATLEPLSMFGEISFLGSYVASSSVKAAEEDAELWILDLKFVKQMFAMEPELSMKFYHFIGSYLAKRLNHVAVSGDKPYISKTEHFVRQTPAVVRKGKITPINEELVIKDYQCKLDKEGVLYIMQHYLAHFAPVFGRERKKIIPFDFVTSLSMDDNLKDIKIVTKQKNKTHVLQFHNTQDCDEAFALIETMLLNRRRDVPFPLAEHHTRAVALYDFKGEHEHDLSFKTNDVIVVLQKRPDGWWLGERRGKMGYFPANFVRDDEGLPTIHDWEIVWLGGVTKELKKGTDVIAEGKRGKGLYQILTGQCVVTVDEKKVGTLEKDETCGEICYLGRCPSPNTISVSSSKAKLREIPSSFLDKLFCNSPALAARVFKYLSVVLEMKLRVQMEPYVKKPAVKDAKKKKKSKKEESEEEEEVEEKSSSADPEDDADDDNSEEESSEEEEEESSEEEEEEEESSEEEEESSEKPAKKTKKKSKK